MNNSSSLHNFFLKSLGRPQKLMPSPQPPDLNGSRIFLFIFCHEIDGNEFFQIMARPLPPPLIGPVTKRVSSRFLNIFPWGTNILKLLRIPRPLTRVLMVSSIPTKTDLHPTDHQKRKMFIVSLLRKLYCNSPIILSKKTKIPYL